MIKNQVRLGKTEIIADKNGFGALPIQRISDEEAGHLLRKAYEHGVNFFDTARFYTDSEHKIGLALSDVRDKIFIATKSMALTGEKLKEELADVLSYCILMADVCGLDLDEIMNEKVSKNEAKYPIEKAYGSAAKYTEFTE